MATQDGAGGASAPMSVTRVPQILIALSQAERPVGLTQLSRDLGVPKSSLISLLRGLVETGYLIAADGAYTLGPSALVLGRALLDSSRRRYASDVVRDGIRDLCQRTGETVLYGVLTQDDAQTMTYVDMAESRNHIRITVAIGDRRPLYCTAGGRALLSARTDDEVRAYLRSTKLEKLNVNTEVSKELLLKAVQETRKDQVARPLGEAIEGVAGISSLIRGSSGEVLGAIVLVAPTFRLDDKGDELASQVLQASRSISRSLGYGGAFLT